MSTQRKQYSAEFKARVARAYWQKGGEGSEPTGRRKRTRSIV